MDFSNLTYLLIPILLYLVGVAISLLLLYGVIRVGVSRGMRDHYQWVERMRPARAEFGDPNAPRRF